jgi:hypothetical protein
MRIKTEPNKTVAVVVGIERYDIGRRWNLDGPASDAVEFVKWLRQRGVPPGNILLFLSPLEENRRLSQGLDVDVHPANRDEIQAALSEKLTEASFAADLLYLFWGGHGVMQADRKRYLFCANAAEHNKLVLDLDEILRMLRSRHRPRIKYQIGLIDACANYFEEMRHHLSLSQAGLSVGDPDKQVRQFVLYSAASGERAENKDVRKTGAFSEAVLEVLKSPEQSPATVWPPDMNGLTERVKARFDELRAAGRASQTPVFYQWQDWEDNRRDWSSERGERGTMEASAGRLWEVSRVREELRRANLSTRQLRQLYVQTLPDARLAAEAENLDQMLERLAQMLPRREGWLPPMLEFAYRVAAKLDDQQLRQWVSAEADAQSQVSDVQELLATQGQAAMSYYLLIDACDADPAAREVIFPDRLEFWVLTEGGQCLRHETRDCRPSREAVEAAILEIVNEVEDEYGSPFVELFVSLHWLCCDADEWEKPNPYGVVSRLGQTSPVALRWGHRAKHLRHTKAGVWREAARRIAEHPQWPAQPDIVWAEAGRLAGEPCLGFAFVPFEEGKPHQVLIAALHNGTAYALWPRSQPGQPDCYRQRLHQKVIEGELRHLPHRLATLRRQALDGCDTLTVFWDDPQRNPLAAQLSPP